MGKLEWLQGAVLGHQKKMIFDYHVLFKQQVNGVRIRGVWAVVEAKLCDEKEDDRDHQLRRRVKMTLVHMRLDWPTFQRMAGRGVRNL